MTNREAISEVRNGLKTVSPDIWLPGKFIFKRLVHTAGLYIKREADGRNLARYTNLWTPIKCLTMEEKPLAECCDVAIPSCKTVMRSKKRIPDVYSTRFGYLMHVSSVEFNGDYIPSDPKIYKYTLSREFQAKSRYFWIDNGHVVIPNSFVERITLRGMFPNKHEALQLDDCSKVPDCYSLLDQDFVAPPDLRDDIIKGTILDLLKTWGQVQSDELPNMNALEKTNPPKRK